MYKRKNVRFIQPERGGDRRLCDGKMWSAARRTPHLFHYRTKGAQKGDRPDPEKYTQTVEQESAIVSAFQRRSAGPLSAPQGRQLDRRAGGAVVPGTEYGV